MDSIKSEDKDLAQAHSISSPPRDVEEGHEAATRKELDRIYRKLDYRIIPALWCLYFMTSFGSNSYGLTLTMNSDQGHSIIQTLKLVGKNTSTASALYYVGYIIFDVPMNLIMTKVRPQSWLSRIVITVGLVYLCYCKLSNSGGLIAARFISGVVGAGTWPGMSYYISLWYPIERQTKRIGFYFTAAQLSASVSGLVNAGFQKMDGERGYYGWQWMYIIYGSVTIAVGISLLWWLPDRPFKEEKTASNRFVAFYNRIATPRHPLTEEEQAIHRQDLGQRYVFVAWGWKDLAMILSDLRVWPLVIMYFGVVGTGFGLAVFGSTIIKANNPSLSSINVSLLYAPIWLFDLGGILTITPFADRFKQYRYLIFCGATAIIMVGMFVTTFAHGPWNKYAGLLIAGYGLGPTVPICMSLAAEIFGARYGDVGIAVSAALVSGLGNLGSVTATYALYSGWPADVPRLYKYSNMMLVVMLGVSCVAAVVLEFIRDRVRQTR
ncbi:hypothetical protein PSN45_004737 [Yamadazyma tenuis]|uniref:MFS general substrate transporter n=1 Tax=Candida tenuis (strain ATCC 10573 / BCRC 21748 / CBS 615 / JCM 9827 / NBRC 10315 / NRRL Y-1498 / VKM Y-70) TaxID=590646 RepID=G3B6Q6_CANTC|nr:MFS general substrate transporter [Yamadazyma tenuis ATCC 10573]EGV62990.1 MFS general substrate transporter [Yamadazyma tenuis ATCC 10573]WEJ97189.1 hypothetical protein PSN45_004737 [Yamadazyma tenuis]